MSKNVTPIGDYANLEVVKRHGDGGGNGLEARVAKLEAYVTIIRDDITEIHSEIKSFRNETSLLREGIAEVKTSIKWITWLQGLIAAAIVSGMIKYLFFAS